MKHTYSTSLWVIIGTVLIAGTVACLFVYNRFEDEEYEIDTFDEHNEDYL